MDKVSHIRAQLEDLVLEFAHRVDHGPTDTVADLFVPDGWYGWGPDKRSIGRENIRAAYRARAAAGLRTARHIVTNLRLKEIDTTHWSGQSIWTIFAENGPPPHPANVLLVTDVNDVFVLHEGRWLFESRQLTDIFTDAAPSAVLPLAAREKTAS